MDKRRCQAGQDGNDKSGTGQILRNNQSTNAGERLAVHSVVAQASFFWSSPPRCNAAYCWRRFQLFTHLRPLDVTPWPDANRPGCASVAEAPTEYFRMGRGEVELVEVEMAGRMTDTRFFEFTGAASGHLLA